MRSLRLYNGSARTQSLGGSFLLRIIFNPNGQDQNQIVDYFIRCRCRSAVFAGGQKEVQIRVFYLQVYRETGAGFNQGAIDVGKLSTM